MSRSPLLRLLSCCALLLAFSAASPVSAQYGGRAYAPENIGQLPVNDQIRVIENEYRDQSGGRGIPDDQLDFYLDQVRDSRWTFSRIQNDISTSLRGNGNGNGNGNWRPPGNGWNQREIICTSSNRQYRECASPFRGPARLSQQISDTRCIEGRNWGARPGLIWVDAGCRARFVESSPNWPSWGNPGANQRQILCESKDSRYQQCNTGFRGAARLSRKLSQNACQEGRSWGQSRGTVWVSRGCRAWFEDTNWNGGGNDNYPGSDDYPGNSGYSITCASSDGRYRTCAWNQSYGRPRLIEQISDKRCVEGSTWGYSGGNLWVNNGCRGRFGSR